MRGFIFDLDGTLLDSIGLWTQIDIDYMKRHKIEYKREYSDVIKRLSYEECALYFKEVLGVQRSVEEIQKDWMEMSYEAYAHHLSLKPFAYEFVKQCAAKGKCIVATSCRRVCAEAALKRCGLDEFLEGIVTTDEIGLNKENPEIYFACADKIGCLPEECYVFEDVVSAATCANRAGFHVIGIHDEMWKNDSDEMKKVCERIITSFDELLEVKK